MRYRVTWRETIILTADVDVSDATAEQVDSELTMDGMDPLFGPYLAQVVPARRDVRERSVLRVESD